MNNRRQWRSGSGFTLLEVLVTLLVLSIGLVGLSALQLRSVQYTHSSYQRTLASIYAKDVAERMWTRLDDPMSIVEQWNKDLGAQQPNWTGAVTRPFLTATPPDPDVYDITVNWSDSRFGTATAYAFTYRVRLLQVIPF